MHPRARAMVAGAVVGAGLLVLGCTTVYDIVNPDVLDLVGGGSRVASLPGDAPAILVAVENRTEWVLEAVVSLRRTQSGVESYTAIVEPGVRTAQALVCPIEEITLGDVADPVVRGAVLWLGNGVPDVDPFIEVEAFNYVLREQVNYDCGDALTFVVQPARTLSGFQIIVYRVPGQG